MRKIYLSAAALFSLAGFVSGETRALLLEIHDPVFAAQIDNARSALEAATRKGYDLVFLELDIPSGNPLHGKEIVEAVAETSGIRTVTYIKDRAYGAGVLIALGSEEIVMRRGSTIGNAGMADADEAQLSPLRATVAGYARQHGLPERLVEAMVDADLKVIEAKTPHGERFYTQADIESLTPTQGANLEVIKTLVNKGKILTLGAREALAARLVRKVVKGRADLFQLYGLRAGEVEIFRSKQAPAASPDQVKAAPKSSPSALQKTAASSALNAGKTVAIIPIRDEGNMVDMGLAGFVRRKINDAKRRKVDVIVFELETWGGRVDSADLITGYISGADPVPTVALVTKKAISAGALITVACDRIYMLKGTMIGSSLPIQMAPGSKPTAVDRKMISALRGEFKAISQKNGHPFHLIEPMVDPDLELVECRSGGKLALLYRNEVKIEREKARKEKRQFQEVKVLCTKGDIFNLAARDAEKYGLSLGTLNSREELWKELGYDHPTLIRSAISWPESIARTLSSPYICGPLMLIGFIALVIEFITPGFGIPGTIGLLCIGLTMWSQYFVGNANPYEILLFLLGFALLAVEVIAIPGFGIVGILGALMIAVSIVLAYIPDAYYYDPSFGDKPWRMAMVERAMMLFGFVSVGSLVSIFVIARYLPLFSVFRKIAVVEAIGTDVPGSPQENLLGDMVGKRGVAVTTLRPAGTAQFQGEYYDVVTEGEFIDPDRPVEIFRIQGNRIFVQEVEQEV